MSITRRLRRPAQLGSIACALLVPATSATALAADPRAQERYYSTYAAPDPAPGPVAQERYYGSYGEPEPLSPPQSPAPSNETPWLPIALSIVGALVIAAASATQLWRVRIRAVRAARSPE